MTNVDITKPVIWTTKGNLNECDCEIYVEWQFAASAKARLFRWLLRFLANGEIVFVRHVKHNGDEVKREPHILKLTAAEGSAATN